MTKIEAKGPLFVSISLFGEVREKSELISVVMTPRKESLALAAGTICTRFPFFSRDQVHKIMSAFNDTNTSVSLF